ncbi:DUF1579 family protein [Dyella sp. Tek66A03]|jgi:hypothetical protein|uniref:DUF1579 family protein n=1 Tax=Dyella sp. Tek66A03 TaxID=3458298 RepID=UPI0031B8F1A7
MAMLALSALAGDWIGDEQIATTRWGQGGPAVGHIHARLELGGRALVQDYREERDGKTALQVHAVFVAGPEHDQYGLYWFDSYGFTPAVPAPGLWDGQRLTFVRSSSRGQTRHVYELLGEGAFLLKLESSFDSGVSWESVMTGSYRRTN